jgi:hypothetical protein
MKLDQYELALRMLEAAVGFRRPPGLSAQEALTYAPDNLRHAYLRAAQAATVYFVECAGPRTIVCEPVADNDPVLQKVPS